MNPYQHATAYCNARRTILAYQRMGSPAVHLTASHSEYQYTIKSSRTGTSRIYMLRYMFAAAADTFVMHA